MGIWLPFLISVLVAALPPIISVSSLDDVQISTSPESIYISTCIVGDNVTYWVSGNYTNREGEILPNFSLPSISQRMGQDQTKIPKQAPGASNANIGFKQSSGSSNLMFGVNSNRLYALDLAQEVVRSSIVLDYPIEAFSVFMHENQTMIFTVSFMVPNLIFTVVTYDSSTGFEQTVFTESFPFGAEINGTDISQYSSTNAYCYVWGLSATGTNVVNMYDLYSGDQLEISLIYSLSAAQLQIATLSPVSFFNVPDTIFGVLCDSTEGIYLFDLEEWFSPNPEVSLVWSSKDPVFYGEVLSCTIDSSYFYVATNTSLLVYELIYTYLSGYGFQLNNEFSYSGEQILSISGLQTDQKTKTISFLVTTANSATSFRVLNNDPSDLGYGFMIFDQWICSIIESDCALSPTPAFFIIPKSTDHFNVCFDSYSSLIFSSAVVTATLETIQSDPSTYIFEGVLSASNTMFYTDKIDFPLRITAWSFASSHIYTTRNVIPSDGFEAPKNISLYLNSQSYPTFDVYLPLSNYFSGQDVIFNTTLGLESSSNVQVVTPDIATFSDSYSFPTESPLVMTKLEFDGFILIAVLSNNQVYMFDGYSQDANLTVLSVVSPSRQGYLVTQFTSVIQQYSDVSMLVVESQTANGIGGYRILWDLFDISNPSEVQYEKSLSFESDELFGKLEGQDSYLYSLRTDSIGVAQVQNINGSFVFTETTPINAATLQISEFSPLKFCTEVGFSDIYVYEAKRGFMTIASSGDTYSYNTTKISISEEPNDVYIYSYIGFIYMLDPLSSSPLVAYTTDTLSIYYPYPNFSGVSYIALQFSYNYFAALSLYQGNLSVFVFNLNEELSTRCLVTVVPLESESTFSFFYRWNGIYNIYAYDGKTLTKWNLGQEQTDWQPVSDYEPYHGILDFTMWTLVQFNFAGLERESSYQATVEITATSGLSGEQTSTSVTIWIVNQGTYIEINADYNSSSQLTSAAPLTVNNETIVIPIPEGYFAGSDITYAFLVNGNQGGLTPQQITCTPKNSLVCIESKEFLCNNCSRNVNIQVLDFDVAGNVTYIASNDLIVGMSLETGQNVTYNITQLLNADESACYMITVVRGAEELVVAMCESVHNYYTKQSLVLLNTSSPDFESSPTLNIAMVIYSLKAVYDTEVQSLKIFVIDFTRVLVYTLQNGALVPYSIISSQSLNFDYVLDPISVEYISNSYILISDAISGLLFALEHNSQSATYSIYQNVSGFSGLNGTNGVASLLLTPDQESVFVLSEAATLYQYSLWNEAGDLNLSQIASVPPVAEDLDQYLLFDTLTTSTDGNYVLFPVFDGSNCRVRVVNISAPFQSRIYTSTDKFWSGLPNQDLLTGNVRILAESDTQLTVAVSLAPSSNSSTFEVFVIRLQTQAFIFPQFLDSASENLITLQLVALNMLSKAVAPEFTVNFTL